LTVSYSQKCNIIASWQKPARAFGFENPSPFASARSHVGGRDIAIRTDDLIKPFDETLGERFPLPTLSIYVIHARIAMDAEMLRRLQSLLSGVLAGRRTCWPMGRPAPAGRQCVGSWCCKGDAVRKIEPGEQASTIPYRLTDQFIDQRRGIDSSLCQKRQAVARAAVFAPAGLRVRPMA